MAFLNFKEMVLKPNCPSFQDGCKYKNRKICKGDDDEDSKNYISEFHNMYFDDKTPESIKIAIDIMYDLNQSFKKEIQIYIKKYTLSQKNSRITGNVGYEFLKDLYNKFRYKMRYKNRIQVEEYFKNRNRKIDDEEINIYELIDTVEKDDLDEWYETSLSNENENNETLDMDTFYNELTLEQYNSQDTEEEYSSDDDDYSN